MRNTNEITVNEVIVERKSWASLYPWVVIGFCSLFLFYKYVLQVSPSVMTQDLMRAFHINGFKLGNLAATYFYAYFTAQILVGPLLDRYSPRNLTIIALGLCALGCIAFSQTESLLAAECSRFLMGAGAGFATVSYMKMSSVWFQSKHMPFVDGLLATAGMVGALAGQVPLTFIINHAGWRQGVMYCGYFGIVLAILFLLFVKDSKGSSLVQKATPKLSDFITLLKNKRNWLLTLYCGFSFTPLSVLGGLWGNPFFVEAHHITTAQAASLTSCIFLGFAIGGPLFGLIADRFKSRIDAMMTGTLLSLVTLLLAIYMIQLPLWTVGTLLCLFGIGTGSMMLVFPVGKSFNHIGLAATVVALINSGDALCGSLTEPFIGKILDSLWNGSIIQGVHHFVVHDYFIALSVLPIYLTIGVSCLIVLKKIR